MSKRTRCGVYRDLHAAHGVDLHLSTQIEAIVGDGAASGVRTTDGLVIEETRWSWELV